MVYCSLVDPEYIKEKCYKIYSKSQCTLRIGSEIPNTSLGSSV